MSEFQDKQLTCVECGGTFVLSADDQALYRDRGYEQPKRCKACRQAKKDRQNANRMKGGKQ